MGYTYCTVHMTRVLAHLGLMSRMRIILSAGVCSIALSGCIPAAAGLALSAASLVTGGTGGKGGEAFKNPIDRQTTGRQIRQALSRLDDQVDPACQAMLDEHYQTHGTLTAGATRQSPDASAETAESREDGKGAETKPPVNLLAKLEPEEAGGSETSAEPSSSEAAEAVEASDATSSEPQPTKVSVSAPAPGRCEHRFVCLPGTPQPTIMLMCPGKGGTLEPEKTMASADTGTAVSGETEAGAAAEAQPSGTASETMPEANPETSPATTSEQATASLETDGTRAQGDAVTDTARSADTVPAAAEAGDAVDLEPERRIIEGGGVADWNWSFDPSKLR